MVALRINDQGRLVAVPNEKDVLTDMRYIRKSGALITDALQKGCDVMQMPNGDVVVTETRTISVVYSWNNDTARFDKLKANSRVSKASSETEHEVLESAFETAA
jgi:hypothetical protein